MNETVTPDVEIKRERIVIPKNYSVDKIQKKYSLKRPAARRAKKTGFGLRTTAVSRSS